MNEFDFIDNFDSALKVILNNLPQEIIFLDEDYNVLWANKAKYDNHPDLRLAQKCYTLFGFKKRCDFCLAEEAVELNKGLKNPVCLLTGIHRNIPRHINIIIIPHSFKQKPGYIEIIDNVEALYQSNAELEQLNREYENVIYTLSHDLRSPLVSIEGFLRKLEKSVQNGDAATFKHCLERIHVNAQNMNALVNVLLDTSRIITGLLDLKENDMGKIAAEIVEQYKPAAAEQGAQIIIKGDFQIEVCDRIRIQQVYSNLINNALKHCREQKNLIIELGANNNVYWVADNGPGIPVDLQDLVFEPFTKGQKSMKDSFGMGMNIVYRIIQKHKGDIWIESNEGEGTKVFFTLKKN